MPTPRLKLLIIPIISLIVLTYIVQSLQCNTIPICTAYDYYNIGYNCALVVILLFVLYYGSSLFEFKRDNSDLIEIGINYAKDLKLNNSLQNDFILGKRNGNIEVITLEESKDKSQYSQK